jgi:hypothetical protein
MYGTSVVDVSDLMRVAFLALEVVERIVAGRQPRAHDASFTDPTF